MSLLDKFTKVVPIHIELPYTDTLHEELLNEFRILHLVYHRNKNQHRVARWWSTFDVIHRHLRKLLLLIQDIHEIKLQRRLSLIHWNNFKKSYYKVKELPARSKIRIKKGKKGKNSKNSKNLKNTFIHIHNKFTDIQGINIINNKLLQLKKEIHYLLKQLIPSAYWLFMGVIELGQFSNLGFTLIGLIAKINSLLQKFDKPIIKSNNLSTDSTSILSINSVNDGVNNGVDDGVDDGVPIEIAPLDAVPLDAAPLDVQTLPQSNLKTKKKKSKKNTKKKSKSIMDDIFG